jgi:hypothetical protein
VTYTTPVLKELDPVTDETVGPRFRMVVLQELGSGWFVDVASPGCDLCDHLSKRDHITVLIDDESIWLDEHADPIIEVIDPELRDDMEAEAPASGAFPDVDAILGAPDFPEGVDGLVVESALHTVVVRAQVASL